MIVASPSAITTANTCGIDFLVWADMKKTKLWSRLDVAIEFNFAMLMASSSLWQRFQRYFLENRELGFSLDINRMKFSDELVEKMRLKIEHAFAAMRELEAGAIANPTENRMVGHYWLRRPGLAPTPEIRSEIENTIRRIKAFAQDVHTGKNRRRKRKAVQAPVAHWNWRLSPRAAIRVS